MNIELLESVELETLMNGTVQMEKGDSHNCIGLAYKVRRREHTVKFLVLPSRREIPGLNPKTKWKFPGGRKEGIEHLDETLKRECKQELARSPGAFDIHAKTLPLVVFPERDEQEEGLVHWKVSFLINQIDGDLRVAPKSEPAREDDGPESGSEAQTILGVPEWVEAEALFQGFRKQGFATRFHFMSAIFALRQFVHEAGIGVAKRYGPILAPFEDFAHELIELMDIYPRSTERFSESFERHRHLLGILPRGPH